MLDKKNSATLFYRQVSRSSKPAVMKNGSVKILVAILFLLPVAFAACIKDSCKRQYTYTYYVAVYKTKEEVRANIKSNPARAIEKPGKISILGNYIFLNEVEKGVHVIDNSNPSLPRNVAFIDIPGNMDIAVKGNILYADLYTDMVTIDISNPSNIKVKKIIENLFPNRGYSGPAGNIVAEWVKRDTTITESCDNQGRVWMSTLANSGPGTFYSAAPGTTASMSPIGIGGSMARFTIINNRLYTVSTSDLDVFNITTADNPTHSRKINLGWNIETIYPFQKKLFIGSQSGMFIYDVTNPDLPIAAGQFNHVRSCDPVITDGDYAYVTLRSGSACQGFTNELDIVKLNNLTSPELKKVYQLTNPFGLSKDGNLLFICDGKSGLKLYDASDVMSLKSIKVFSEVDAYDVIAYNKIALVVAKQGLFQYDYANPNNMRLLSKIPVSN